MRSIRRRAGWSMVAKKSGSLTATRSTGICSRANQTRTAAGMRSSVRMLWNSSATISIVARSSGVAAARFSACLRWCSSSSITGVGDLRVVAGAAVGRQALADAVPARCRWPRASAGDSGCAACVGVGEVRHVAADQPVQPAEHRLGMLASCAAAGRRASSGASRRRRSRRGAPPPDAAAAVLPPLARRHWRDAGPPRPWPESKPESTVGNRLPELASPEPPAAGALPRQHHRCWARCASGG